ncbi:MAG: hypothetical protein WBM44_02945 [Waterburya sp.]
MSLRRSPSFDFRFLASHYLSFVNPYFLTDALVQREVIYCVSSLVYSLTQEKQCLDEELSIDLWTGSINYDDAEQAIKGNNAIIRKEDELYGVYDEDLEDYIVEPSHNDKKQAIDEYFGSQNFDLDDYRSEVFEHWLVSSWLFKKLQEQGESVVEMYGLYIWCRTTTGMAIAYDCVIKEIYQDLIDGRLYRSPVPTTRKATLDGSSARGKKV